MLAQNFAQPGLQQVGGGVIAHGGLADVGVNHGIHLLANPEGAPPNTVFVGWGFHEHLVCPYSLHGVVATSDFGNHSVVIVAVEPPTIANLSAGFRVEGRVIKDDFAFLAGLEFLRALALADDGEDFAAIRADKQG
jgi:hypothetical protein